MQSPFDNILTILHAYLHARSLSEKVRKTRQIFRLQQDFWQAAYVEFFPMLVVTRFRTTKRESITFVAFRVDFPLETEF